MGLPHLLKVMAGAHGDLLDHVSTFADDDGLMAFFLGYDCSFDEDATVFLLIRGNLNGTFVWNLIFEETEKFLSDCLFGHEWFVFVGDNVFRVVWLFLVVMGQEGFHLLDSNIINLIEKEDNWGVTLD